MKRYAPDVFVLLIFVGFSQLRFHSVLLTAGISLPILIACVLSFYRQSESYQHLILGNEAISTSVGLVWVLSCVIGAVVIDSMLRAPGQSFRALQAYVFAVGYCGIE